VSAGDVPDVRAGHLQRVRSACRAGTGRGVGGAALRLRARGQARRWVAAVVPPLLTGVETPVRADDEQVASGGSAPERARRAARGHDPSSRASRSRRRPAGRAPAAAARARRRAARHSARPGCAARRRGPRPPAPSRSCSPCTSSTGHQQYRAPAARGRRSRTSRPGRAGRRSAPRSATGRRRGTCGPSPRRRPAARRARPTARRGPAAAWPGRSRTVRRLAAARSRDGRSRREKDLRRVADRPDDPHGRGLPAAPVPPPRRRRRGHGEAPDMGGVLGGIRCLLSGVVARAFSPRAARSPRSRPRPSARGRASAGARARRGSPPGCSSG
jgi:hypothetical protein